MASGAAHGTGKIDFPLPVPKYANAVERRFTYLLPARDLFVGGCPGLPLRLSNGSNQALAVFYGTGAVFYHGNGLTPRAYFSPRSLSRALISSSAPPSRAKQLSMLRTRLDTLTSGKPIFFMSALVMDLFGIKVSAARREEIIYFSLPF